MRAVELAKVAAQAEKIRLQRMARRQAMRGVYGAVAAVFALGMLAWLHITVFIALANAMRPVWAALIVMVADLAIAGVLGWMAASSKPDNVEQEAQRVKEQALIEMREAVALTALVGPLGRVLGRKHVYGLTLAALTAQFLGSARRG